MGDNLNLAKERFSLLVRWVPSGQAERFNNMDDTFQTAQLVSGTKILQTCMRTINPVGHYRSLPAEIDTPCPSVPVVPPGSRQHPVPMTSTVGGVGVVPKEATNDSNLVTECPPESTVDRAVD